MIDWSQPAEIVAAAKSAFMIDTSLAARIAEEVKSASISASSLHAQLASEPKLWKVSPRLEKKMKKIEEKKEKKLNKYSCSLMIVKNVIVIGGTDCDDGFYVTFVSTISSFLKYV